MNEPSPAARAIVQAFDDEYDHDWFDLRMRRHCLAAVLRALADQVVPDEKAPTLARGPDLRRLAQRQHTRAQMLALAAELEAP